MKVKTNSKQAPKVSPTNNVNMLNNIMKEIADKKGTNKKK